MGRRATFTPYQPKTILNKSKRADHWFWTRYSAYPYKGCQHGCEFCYCRERKYSPYDDPQDFAYRIQVKENAPLLLHKALSRLPVEAVAVGDYQPAERKYRLSRDMLGVCLDLGFPVFVLERSPLVTRDLDLLAAIHDKARAVVAFSIITTPDSPDYERVHKMEGLAPTSEKRFIAMERIAAAGIPTGTCMMPILPEMCDSEENLRQVVRWTAEHGGSFVLAGGLTLSDQQHDYFFNVLEERIPDLLDAYHRLFPPGSYSSDGWRWQEVARTVHELCAQAGIKDRMTRPVIPGEKRARNKRIVESLADKAYALQIHEEPEHRVWAYRKAAWAIEDLEQDVGLIYERMGESGLSSIPEIGSKLAGEITDLLETLDVR